MKQKETITATIGEVYREVFDVKLLRERTVLSARCQKCFNWGPHHRPSCVYATKADALAAVDVAKADEKRARDRATEWLAACRAMHGKIAILKHENNMLRRKVAPQPNHKEIPK